jgi:serine/threonine protein kinase
MERKEELKAVILSKDDLITFSESKLGSGRFAVVFLGYCAKVDDRVAVKRLTCCENGIKEVLVMKDLGEHKNIVSFYGYFQSKDYIDIVMEVAPFGALSQLLEDKTGLFQELPPLLMLSWLCDVSDALKYMRSKHVKHKDIKAENILVYRMFHTKICDFGLAKEQDLDCTSSTCAGTLVFMAPEIRDNGESTDVSDVFSFGITALQIMNRQIPQQVLPARRGQQIANVVSQLTLPFMENELIVLLTSCCEEDPMYRPSAEEVHRRLMEILESNGSDPRNVDNVWYWLIEEMDSAKAKSIL